MKDRGVNPGLVERAFRKISWEEQRDRTGRQRAIAGMLEQATKTERLQKDVVALEAIQQSRPLKPPRKRP